MPESFENIRLAGGRRTIFTLQDADYTFQSGKLSRLPLHGKRFWRSFETYPLIHWKSYPLAELTFAICHPMKAFGEWRGRLAYKINSSRHPSKPELTLDSFWSFHTPKITMRKGQNPAKFVKQVAQPQRITVAVLNYIPFLSGFYAQTLDVLKTCLGIHLGKYRSPLRPVGFR